MPTVKNYPWPTVYVLVGIPGSGKSTWAATEAPHRNAVIVSRDAIRAMLTGSDKKMAGDAEFEELVTQIENESVALAIRRGRNVILDATNTYVKGAIRRMDVAASSVLRPHGPFPNVRLVTMDTPFDECMARNAARDHPVPTDVLHRMNTRIQKELAG